MAFTRSRDRWMARIRFGSSSPSGHSVGWSEILQIITMKTQERFPGRVGAGHDPW